MLRPAVINAVAVALRLALGGIPNCPAHAAEPRAEAPAAAENPQRLAAEAECQFKTPAELIALLGDERFHLRQCAEDKLHELLHQASADPSNEVEQICYETYRTHPDPEIRGRVRAVLADFATNLWSSHGFLGLAIAPDSGFAENGDPVSLLKINKVLENGPAAKAGIKVNDLIHRIDEVRFKETTAAKQFDKHLALKKPGESVVLELERDSNIIQVTVVLGCKPRVHQRDENRKEMPLDPERCLREYLAAKKP